MVISAVLLPSEADSQQLIAYSEYIGQQSHSLIELSEHFLPHISLVQYEVETDETEALWGAVQEYSSAISSLTAAGLSFVPDRYDDSVWAELLFLKSEILAELQNNIAECNFGITHTSHTPLGDSWRPHCTIALFENSIIPSLKIDKNSIFNRTYDSLRLAVGINGENWTFIEPKFS